MIITEHFVVNYSLSPFGIFANQRTGGKMHSWYNKRENLIYSERYYSSANENCSNQNITIINFAEQSSFPVSDIQFVEKNILHFTLKAIQS